MREKSKNILSLILRFGLSAALLIYLSRQIDAEHTVEVVKSADIGFILLGLAIFLLVNLGALIRWWGLIKALELDVTFQSVVRYYFIGLFGNLFLPTAIGGDLIKTIGLCTNSQQKPKVVGSVLLDRLSGFAGLVVVAILAYVFGHSYIGDPSLLMSIGVLAAVSIVATAVLFHEGIYSFCCRIFTPFPRIKEGLMDMHYDIALLKGRKSTLVVAVGISCFIQAILALMFMSIAWGLHQQVALIYFLIFVPLICVASAVPSIGGLGVREAGAVYLFGKIGVASGVALSISLMSFLYMVFIGLVGAGVYLMTRSPKPAELAKQAGVPITPEG